jgi:hypothetical protein
MGSEDHRERIEIAQGVERQLLQAAVDGHRATMSFMP